MAAVDDLLTCAICLDWFKSPRTLPCHHVYCLDCLRSIVTTGTDFLTCPECRRDHVTLNGRVEEFPVNGRLEQFIDKLNRPQTDSCRECQQYSSLSDCDHCQRTICLKCQAKHRAQLLESLLQEFLQFHVDFCTENQKTKRQSLKTELLSYNEIIGALKIRVNQEIDALIKELETRRLVLLLRVIQEETLICQKLSELEKADLIEAQLSSISSEVVESISLTNALVLKKEELSEQKQLMTSLQTEYRKKGILSIRFDDDQKLKKLIGGYGVLFTAVDYKKELRLVTTIDGSESCGAFNVPWGVTVCPFSGNVYVTDSTSIRLYNSDGVCLRHALANEVKCGLAVDIYNHRVIVSGIRENDVKIYDHDLRLIKSFGSKGKESGHFSVPMGVACDLENIYVVERDNHRIQVFTLDGAFKSVIGHGVLKDPWCVQINERQELVVTNDGHGRVDMFNKDGTYLRSITGEGENKLKSPRGIFIDAKGRILVADHASKKIQVFEDDGTHYCAINQPAAALNDMRCLAVTESGVIFITDIDGHKIHLIATA